jgi:poly-beta-1,6-N-acetyl-D-glucosamine synthase
MIPSAVMFSGIGLIVIACTVIYAMLILYTASGFKKIHLHETNNSVFVSVLIPVRNEEENIVKLLNALSEQTYPSYNFEVVVINDHSDDATVKLVNEYILSGKIKNLELQHLDAEYGKKAALVKGVSLSKGSLIVTVDGDCFMQRKWLSAFAGMYEKTQAPMIAGPVMLEHQSGMLSLLQHAEYMALQICGLGSLQRGKPLLCSGANLAFTREAYQLVNGYSGNMTIASGDDTFMMLKMFEKGLKPVPIINSNAIVTTAPLKNYSEVIQQRRRWAGKVSLYKNNFYIKFFGVIFILANLMAVAALFRLFTGYIDFLLVCMLQKLIIDYYVLAKGARFFKTKMSPAAFLLMMIYPVSVIVLAVYSLSGPYLWKGRKIQNKH